MAYADKITNMRRMALIRPNHNIIWEGVNIEGTCLLQKNEIGYEILRIEENELDDFCFYHELEIKYQDKKTDIWWEPRK